MLALEPIIRDRLAAVDTFADWDVRRGTEVTDRHAVPAIDVRLGSAQVGAATRAAASLSCEWVITLCVDRSEHAADQLDAAVASVIRSLHDWRPPLAGSRKWGAMQLSQVQQADFIDVARVGYQLSFICSAVFDGHR